VLKVTGVLSQGGNSDNLSDSTVISTSNFNSGSGWWGISLHSPQLYQGVAGFLQAADKPKHIYLSSTSLFSLTINGIRLLLNELCFTDFFLHNNPSAPLH